MSQIPPAFLAFDAVIDAQTGKDLRRGFRLWRVYRSLKRSLHFRDPRDVKVAALSHELHLSPRLVIEALDWLTENGYIVDEGRGDRRVRSLTLAWELQPRNAA